MQICHGEEIYFFKTNSTVSIHSPMHMMLESLENLTLWMAQRCCLSFVGLWKKKHCKWQRSLSRWSGAAV